MVPLRAMLGRIGRAAGLIAWAVLTLIVFLLGPGQGLIGGAGAGEVLAGPVAAEVIAFQDGDTVTARAHVWLGQVVTVKVRLAGIDTPETDGACASERQLAARARAYVIAAIGGAPVRLHDIRYGKYAGRVVAKVITAENVDLGATLIARGLAKPYDGRRRPDWCAPA